MSICFVIQPFDEGRRFDKRYEDIYVPAIEAAELEAYRVDRDPSSTIPIEQIEEGIRKADACLADVSTDNPNVWFELGYAIATGKPVILVCEYQEGRRFPFDIQHRTIITYRSESARDFETLNTNITQIAEIEGLNQHELVALVTIAENLANPDDSVATESIRSDMERAGYTRIAATLALTTLLRKGMISSSVRHGEYDQTWTEYSVTEAGMTWLLENQHMFLLRRTEPKEPMSTRPPTDDNVPF
jgi:nucleoside 2-deoxyribosyltransferase